MRFVKTYLVSIFIVFMHFGGQITYWTDPQNRYYYGWRELNGIALVCDLFLIALAVTLLALLLKQLTQRRSLAGLQNLLDHLLPLAFASGVLSVSARYFVADHPKIIPLSWMFVMSIIGWSLASSRSRVVQYTYNVCLLFSPAPFLLSVQILTWGSWYDAPKTSLANRKAETQETPVFLFVFDEWSYARSASCGEFRPLFRNIRDFCNRAIVFRKARSPGPSTEISLPRLIYQTSLEIEWREGVAYWKQGNEEKPSTEVPSLFQFARERNYNCYLTGWRVPYNRLLGEQVDYCHTRCGDARADCLGPEMLLAVQRNLPEWTDPLSQSLSSAVTPRVFCQHVYRAAQEARDEMLRIIDSCPPNTFALFHVRHPHGPHIFNSDGTYAGPNLRFDAEDYEQSLVYLDFLFGQIVERLRAAHKFDGSLIVVTSDHSFRLEPEPTFRQDVLSMTSSDAPDWRRRVPLFIKLPGQRSATVVDDPLCTNGLAPLFKSVFRGDRDPNRLIELVRDLASGSNRE